MQPHFLMPLAKAVVGPNVRIEQSADRIEVWDGDACKMAATGTAAAYHVVAMLVDALTHRHKAALHAKHGEMLEWKMRYEHGEMCVFCRTRSHHGEMLYSHKYGTFLHERCLRKEPASEMSKSMLFEFGL